MGKHAKPREESRHWRRRIGIVAATALTAGAVVGVAGAAPTTSTTDVAFVTLTPSHKVLSNATISANKTTSPVVIGGTTTVPSNATTVKLTVTAKGAATGVLNFYPAGNPSGGSGQSLAWAAGATVSTAIEENVGMSGELTFANSSTGSVVVTATIVGYSTQVTAGDISPTGGTAGQVLTNTGNGANWQDPGGPAYASTPQAFDVFLPSAPFNFATMTSLTVAAGTYLVSATGLVFNNNAPAGTSDYIHCFLISPGGQTINDTEVGILAQAAEASEALEGLMTTTGGTIALSCYHATSETGSQFEGVYNPSLVALRVSSGTGNVTSNARRAAPTIPTPHGPVSIAGH